MKNPRSERRIEYLLLVHAARYEVRESLGEHEKVWLSTSSAYLPLPGVFTLKPLLDLGPISRSGSERKQFEVCRDAPAKKDLAAIE